MIYVRYAMCAYPSSYYVLSIIPLSFDNCLLSATAKTEQQDNRPRSIYQYSNMAPRLSGQTSIFGVAFFVSKSLLGIERQKKLKLFTRKPRSHV